MRDCAFLNDCLVDGEPGNRSSRRSIGQSALAAALLFVARISGVVELLVLVGRDGGVLSVEVLSGNPLLAGAAKHAVQQWRYRPAVLDGQAVEVEAHVTVNFVLN